MTDPHTQAMTRLRDYHGALLDRWPDCPLHGYALSWLNDYLAALEADRARSAKKGVAVSA